MNFFRRVPLMAGVLAGLAATLAADEGGSGDRMMVLTVDMTKEGKKIAPPTPERPAYYVPVMLGYKELGDVIKHYERKPSDEAVFGALVSALAKRGYLPASRQHPPSLTISFEWGTIAPIFVNQTVINAAEIRGRVIGFSGWEVKDKYGGLNQEMLSLTARHYLVVTAFEFSRTPKKEEVLLWCAHSSTDAWGNFLEEVIDPMIKLVTPALGRETKPGAGWSEPNGRVIIGEPEVKDFPAAPAKQ